MWGQVMEAPERCWAQSLGCALGPVAGGDVSVNHSVSVCK